MKFERDYSKKKAGIPVGIKFALLIATVIGFYISRCTTDLKDKYLLVSNARVEVIDSGSVEVFFDLKNDSPRKGNENFMIEVYDENNELIVDKLVAIYLIPNKTKSYRKIIGNLYFAADRNQKYTAEIKVHKASFF